MTGAERALFQPRVLIAFIACVLIWGSTWLVITGQLGVVAPAWSVAYRMSIGAAILFIWSASRRLPLALDGAGHRVAAAIGIPQFCLNFDLVYLAEQYVTSGLVAMVFALLMVPNSLLAWLFLKQKISGRFLLGSAVAVAGVALLFTHELGESEAGRDDVIAGISFSLLAVLCVSGSNVIQGAARARSRPLAPLTAWAMAYGVLANILIASILNGPPTFDASFVYVSGLIYLGLFGSAIAFTLYFFVIREIGPGRAAYSSLLIPIIAMALSTAFEGYRWSLLAVAGCLLALLGVFIALRARRTEVPAA